MKWIITFLLGVIMLFRHRKRGAGISIIIPFRAGDEQRLRDYEWLKSYWKKQLPKAEVITGLDYDANKAFSKSAAVNEGFSRSHGDVIVIVDADGYIDAKSILECAFEIRKSRQRGQKLWYVPYRHFYRLTREATELVLESSPKFPFRFTEPPDRKYVLDTTGSHLGHWYGAVIQIMPREAFCEVGGWDVRFRGWGGEDHAAMRAMDTLYWHHKTLPGQVLHLWHPMLTSSGKKEFAHWKDRLWEKQEKSSSNDELSGRYYGAHGHPERMRKLVDEGINAGNN